MKKLKLLKSSDLDLKAGTLELAGESREELEELANGVFVTDDPSLVLILNVLHHHEVVSEGYLDGHHNTHFVFKSDRCLDEHLANWDRIASDDCSIYENLFQYMVGGLGESEYDSFVKLTQDLSTFNRELHK